MVHTPGSYGNNWLCIKQEKEHKSKIISRPIWLPMASPNQDDDQTWQAINILITM